jgi:ubiquinone/menaquinone biosynthesis C-methylase UbiE
MALILDSDNENPLFLAPIHNKNAQILDIGTGQGNWAM